MARYLSELFRYLERHFEYGFGCRGWFQLDSAMRWLWLGVGMRGDPVLGCRHVSTLSIVGFYTLCLQEILILINRGHV